MERLEKLPTRRLVLGTPTMVSPRDWMPPTRRSQTSHGSAELTSQTSHTPPPGTADAMVNSTSVHKRPQMARSLTPSKTCSNGKPNTGQSPTRSSTERLKTQTGNHGLSATTKWSMALKRTTGSQASTLNAGANQLQSMSHTSVLMNTETALVMETFTIPLDQSMVSSWTSLKPSLSPTNGLSTSWTKPKLSNVNTLLSKTLTQKLET